MFLKFSDIYGGHYITASTQLKFDACLNGDDIWKPDKFQIGCTINTLSKVLYETPIEDEICLKTNGRANTKCLLPDIILYH